MLEGSISGLFEPDHKPLNLCNATHTFQLFLTEVNCKMNDLMIVHFSGGRPTEAKSAKMNDLVQPSTHGGGGFFRAFSTDMCEKGVQTEFKTVEQMPTTSAARMTFYVFVHTVEQLPSVREVKPRYPNFCIGRDAPLLFFIHPFASAQAFETMPSSRNHKAARAT